MSLGATLVSPIPIARRAPAPVTIPTYPNERWTLDFVSDQLTDEYRFRILTIVDDGTRERLVLVADSSLSGIRGEHVYRIL